MENKNKSKIIITVIAFFLLGYIGYQIYKSDTQKKEIRKLDFMIGKCAKSKSPFNTFRDITTLEHMKEALNSSEFYYEYFKECEKEFMKAPKAFRLKWGE